MKRTFSDKLFDNFGWVMLGTFLFVVIGTSLWAYELVSHANEIASELGGIARSAADGYSHAK